MRTVKSDRTLEVPGSSFNVLKLLPTGLISLVLASLSQASLAQDIELTLLESVGTARTGEGVTGGIPLPTGSQPGDWALFEGDREIPIQFLSLPGRAGNWGLLDFQVDVGANAQKRLTLRRTARTASHPSPISVTEDASSINVDTGAITVSISKTNFDFFDAITVGGQDLAVPGTPALQVLDSTGGDTYSARPDDAEFLWEDAGDIRRTLRIDGTLSASSGAWAGVAYTARLTFYAGSSKVKAVVWLRNSLATNERHIKVRSATLRFGNGDNVVRSNGPGHATWAGGSGGGVLFEMVPENYYTTSDSNGGIVIPDLSHYRATLVVDFGATGTSAEQSVAAANPLFPLAPPEWYRDNAVLTTERFGTLEDERNAYRQWNWTWSGSVEPTDQLATGTANAIPDYSISWLNLDIHGDSESDDLWQHLIMYMRTGQRSYWDRARAWARYMTDEYAYRTDGFDYAWDGNFESGEDRVSRPRISIPLTGADSSYLGSILNPGAAGRIDVRYDDFGADHMWGWGLIDYFYLTGDRAALDAVADIGEISERVFGYRSPGFIMGGSRMRQGARHLLLTTRLYEATGDPRWNAHMLHMAELWLQSPDWDDRGIYEVNQVIPFHIGYLHKAFWLYWRATGDQRARDRMIAISRWAAAYGLHEVALLSGKTIKMDDPNGLGPEGIWHSYHDEATDFCDPVYTVSWIDTLVRGYRLTNDTTLLERAKLHWDRGSKAEQRTCNRVVGDNVVGRFQNNKFLFSGIRQYYDHNRGDLSYTHLLFAEFGVPSPDRPAPPSLLSVE